MNCWNQKKNTKPYYYMLDGLAYFPAIPDKEGKPQDYLCLEVNDAFERIARIKKEELLGKKLTGMPFKI